MTTDRGAENQDPIWFFGASSITFPDSGDHDPFSDPGTFAFPTVSSSGSSGRSARDDHDSDPHTANDGEGSPGASGSSLSPTEADDGTTRITRLNYGRHVRMLLVEPDPQAAAAFIRAGDESVLDVRIEVVDDPEVAVARLERSFSPRLRKAAPDVVVTSIEVSEAHRLLELIRLDPRFDDLPVLVLAPTAAPSDERRSFGLGAAGHLVTPTRDYERVALMHALPDFIPSARAAHAHLQSHRR